ncbi:MAG TPA: hypothetical protein VG273_28375 [Bryobacteraceae bacterium]|jgi:hypothetical protein|nr:hypothetical protein [Bryobacteraceae bacterium]
MATAVHEFYQSDVFGLQNQRAISGFRSNQHTDVFASRQRRSAAAITEPRPHRVKLEIIGLDAIELTYFGSTLPPWAEPVLKSLPERWGATPGWDGYRAVPTSWQLVVRMLNILSLVMRNNFPPPQITPLADGGVQAEWHLNQKDLEIEVSAAELPTYYFFDQSTGEEEEATLDQHESRVGDLIGGLR